MKRTKNKKKKSKEWYDFTCYEMGKRLKLLGKLCSNSPKDPFLRGRLITTRKEYNKLIRYKKQSWKNDIIKKIEETEEKNTKEYWNLIDKLKDEKKETTIYNPEKFQSFFKNLYSGKSLNIEPFHKNIEQIVKNSLQNEDKNIIDADITLEEIKKYIIKLKNNKSSGPDRIPAEMIKASPDNMLKILVKLVNVIKNSFKYPGSWATGITSLLLKEGDEEDPNNYRAINVCNTMSKLFTIIMNERLNLIFKENNLIGDYQIGFKKGARPSDHIFVLKSAIDRYLENGKKLYACFVDFQKAYDNVWRDGLYFKLLNAGIKPNFIKVIKDMNDKTQQCLKMNGYITDPFPSLQGLRQGCVLSPLLFNIFINDLPDIFDKSCCPIKLYDKNINCLMYADDVVILSESKEGLKECLKHLSLYVNQWCLTVNQKKTKTLTFQKGGKMKKLNLLFNGNPLEDVSEYKYLGTLINRSGNFKLNNTFLKNKGLRASFSMIKSIGLNI